MEIEKEILNEGSWATILNNPETQQGEAADYAPDTAPQDRQAEGVCPERDGGQTVAAVREEQTKEPFLVVRYNHENQNLSLEEAKIAAQKGIRFSSISEKLDRLAAIKQTSVEALIDSMLQNERDTYTLNDYRIFNKMLKDIREHNASSRISIDKNLEYR